MHVQYFAPSCSLSICIFFAIGKGNTLESELGSTAGIVFCLTEPICGRGHHLYTENFYTSPALFADCGFEACGTLRLNHRGVPLEANAVLKRGERRSIPVHRNMTVVQWHDKCTVSVLSTVHGDSPVEMEHS